MPTVPDPWSSPLIITGVTGAVTSAIGTIGTLITMILRHRWDVQDRQRIADEANLHHSETVGRIDKLEGAVDGKLTEFMRVSGNAREAKGNLAGHAEEKAYPTT